jgi:hypothetical protein
MSKKLLIAAALVAGSASVAFAAEDMKTEAAEKGAEAKKMKKVAKPSKKAPAHMKHAQMPAHHKVAEAKGLTVTLGGDLTAQVGHRKQKATYNTDRPGVTPNTANRTQNMAIVNDTHVSVKADGHAHGMKYGGKVVLNADSSNSKYGYGLTTQNNNIAHETKAYVTTMFGKLEAGSTTGAYANMKVSSANFAHATGGIDGDSQYWVNPYLYNNGTYSFAAAEHFVVNPNLPTNYVHGLDAHSAKISYYTPSYMGFKVGVSYTPDSEQRGTVSKTSSVYRNVATDGSLTGYKNVWEGGLRYKGKFDGVGIQASVMGNSGDAKGFNKSSSVTFARHNLKAWEAGAALSYMGFTVAGSYADMGKSGTAKTYNGTNALTGKKKSNFWNVGAAYEYSNLGASLTYMESTHGAAAVRTSTAGSTSLNKISSLNVVTLNTSNKYTAMSFGVDYKLAPGFMPYAEVTRFELKEGRPSQTLNTDNIAKARYKNSGYVVLAGTKLQF